MNYHHVFTVISSKSILKYEREKVELVVKVRDTKIAEFVIGIKTSFRYVIVVIIVVITVIIIVVITVIIITVTISRVTLGTSFLNNPRTALKTHPLPNVALDHLASLSHVHLDSQIHPNNDDGSVDGGHKRQQADHKEKQADN